MTSQPETSGSPGRIGPWRMSGLIIGPILGSGIIILPPLARQLAGDWAIAAWVATIVLSFLFAWFFGKLSMLYPGDSGIAAAVEAAFGPRASTLASVYLIGAVCFGPVAVMLTIARYLPLPGDSDGAVTGAVLSLLAYLLLNRRLSAIGTVALATSSVTSCILFSCSLIVLSKHGVHLTPDTPIQLETFMSTLLLLFWAVVGWEVVGNFSGELREPSRNLPRAVTASALVIGTVTITVTLAVQNLAATCANEQPATLIPLLEQAFGEYAPVVMGVLTLMLCGCTFLLFVGGTARLIAALAGNRVLPALFARRTASGAPGMALAGLAAVHFCLFAAVRLGLLDLQQLVAIANGFFLCNCLSGILSGIRLFDGLPSRITGVLLCVVLLTIFLHSSLPVIAVAAGLALLVFSPAVTTVDAAAKPPEG